MGDSADLANGRKGGESSSSSDEDFEVRVEMRGLDRAAFGLRRRVDTFTVGWPVSESEDSNDSCTGDLGDKCCGR